MLKVTKSNALIRASYRLTLLELRIILFGISKLNPKRELPLRHSVNCHEMADFYELKVSDLWRQVKEAFCERFFDRKITLKEGNITIISRWIYEIKIDEEAKILNYVYNPSIVPHLSQLERGFTNYGLQYIAQMKSMYSIRFYEWSILHLNAAQKNKISYQKTVAELKEDLAIEGKYTQLGDFKKNVLEAAKKEISELTNIDFDFYIEKRGNHLQYIGFIAAYKPSQKHIKLPLISKSIETDDISPKMRNKQRQKYVAEKSTVKSEDLKTTCLQPDEIDSCNDVERLVFSIKDNCAIIKEFEPFEQTHPSMAITLKNSREMVTKCEQKKKEIKLNKA